MTEEKDPLDDYEVPADEERAKAIEELRAEIAKKEDAIALDKRKIEKIQAAVVADLQNNLPEGYTIVRAGTTQSRPSNKKGDGKPGRGPAITDDQLRAYAAKGGVMQASAIAEHFGCTDQTARTTLQRMGAQSDGGRPATFSLPAA